MIDVSADIVTLKTNDLLVFVDETGPLTITRPEASIIGGAWSHDRHGIGVTARGSVVTDLEAERQASPAPVGAVNSASPMVGSLNVTAGPAVWVHA